MIGFEDHRIAWSSVPFDAIYHLESFKDVLTIILIPSYLGFLISIILEFATNFLEILLQDTGVTKKQ